MKKSRWEIKWPVFALLVMFFSLIGFAVYWTHSATPLWAILAFPAVHGGSLFEITWADKK